MTNREWLVEELGGIVVDAEKPLDDIYVVNAICEECTQFTFTRCRKYQPDDAENSFIETKIDDEACKRCVTDWLSEEREM